MAGKKCVYILSVDGGGIRGMIPAVVLRTLEGMLEDRPLCEAFDLMAGTSTGSLIVLGLAAPKRNGSKYMASPAFSARDIVDIYRNMGERIFPQGRLPGIKSVGQAFSEKYDPEGIDKALDEIFGPLTMQDSLVNLLVTSCRTETGSPLFFKKRPPRYQWRDDENFLMRDAARASCAAPTYFPPAYIHPLDDLCQPKKRGYTLVDGGLVAAIPAMCAYIEARKIYPEAKRFVILSLGTGEKSPSYEQSDIRKWGYIDWVNPAKGSPLLSLMNSSQVECVRHQLFKLPGIDYIRINGGLGKARAAMDDASPENLEHLIRAGERIIDENSDRLDRMLRLLS